MKVCILKLTFVAYSPLVLGEQIVKADDDYVLFLDPVKGNIHQISANEDDTAFFDVLLPGYTTSCLYYSQMKDSRANATGRKVGEVCLLKQIDPPRDYYTETLYYPRLNAL